MGVIIGGIMLMWFIVIILIMVGETYVRKNPDEIFSKWWRKHLVKDSKDNDDMDDSWMYM